MMSLTPRDTRHHSVGAAIGFCTIGNHEKRQSYDTDLCYFEIAKLSGRTSWIVYGA